MAGDKKDTLDAVIVADNFSDCFKPFTSFTSPALLPLINVPLLSYALEALNRNGVENVYIFCATYPDKIRAFVNDGNEQRLTWSVGMTVHVVPSPDSGSFGDAMRRMDSAGHLRRDFILINFDTITNAKLFPAIIKKHKENCKQDKNTVMTAVYKKVSSNQRTGNEVMIATDKSGRMLYHQRIDPTKKEVYFNFPMEIFLQNKEVEMHHDLLDPHIAICSADVLPLFSDNFDYDTRDQFIRGLVMNQEITASSIYVACLPKEEYAAKVSDWKAYHMVAQDLINRWVYPIVPDMGVCSFSQQYLFKINNIYRHKAVMIDRDCRLIADIVINENCTVAEQTSLQRAVFGKHCLVGSNTHITNAYMFNHVKIGKNCVLENCVIGNNVEIPDGCTISGGTVIADNVILSKGQVIDGWILQSVPSDPTDEYAEQEFEKIGEHAYRLIEQDKPVKQITDSDDDLADDEIVEEFIKLAPYENDCASSVFSETESVVEEVVQVYIPDDTHIFMNEVIDSLKRGYEKTSDPNYLVLEVNSSRYAYNMTLNEVNFYFSKAVIHLTMQQKGKDPMEDFKTLFVYLGPIVIRNYIRDDQSQEDCLNALLECCEEEITEAFKPKLAKLIHFLYDEDILTEEAIVSWTAKLGDESEWAIKLLQPLIDWFEEVSEEESSDE